MKTFFSKNHIQIIAMGASTGGTEALLSILEKLPANLPPIVITQHMPPVFTQMYAERLEDGGTGRKGSGPAVSGTLPHCARRAADESCSGRPRTKSRV